ncbi:hypothetical protein C805_00815 [Eubacterium sp. 14-2]|uniref:MAE_28990/MAE_18760 family HEPN-like nuclease n=1 Tax=Eubacterium sp. 14-2 TaxID=1235790 RepID=UPI000337E7F7|nr:MAE_28990/MAE_18760 family HEPN-like nuclease [Eubacterium sp. 14-2]EOT26713.1 hypothetical protein C805_00815 [Eubacterium sp. 14-2]
MTADEFRANLESELAWRQEEIAFFKNQLNYISENDKSRYRKSLVLILYSHLEGYIKLSLQMYVQYINSLSLTREVVKVGLKAASMNKEFNAYDNLDRKCEIFRRELPDDSGLHRFFRRVDFMSQYEEFMGENLEIDDSIINTESNLWYVVLQKNLYKLGLPVDLFQEYETDIDALVNRRNSIAHGNFRSGVSAEEFQKWENGTMGVLSGVTRLLYDYACNERYKKAE